MMRHRIAAAALALAALALSAGPVAAKILKTRRPGEYQPLTLIVGSGTEFETDGEESQYGFPFFAEYGFSKMIKASVEPNYLLVRKQKGGSIGGLGDLETAVTCEFPTERRYRPGLALVGVVKWPTAPRPRLGTGKMDYSFGGIVSKEFVGFDLDLNALYTIVGRPAGVRLQNTFEVSLAGEWHLTRTLDLEAEVVNARGAAGRFHGQTGSLGGFANIGGPEQGQIESEVTLGLARRFGEFFKLEQGAVLKSGGSWQLVFAWEYDFSGGK